MNGKLKFILGLQHTISKVSLGFSITTIKEWVVFASFISHKVFLQHQTPSWQWYYPYHFAPFAADFLDVEHMDIKFNLGQPFKPFEQLMSVFPAARFVLLCVDSIPQY